MHSTKFFKCFCSLTTLIFLLFCPAPIRAEDMDASDLLLFMPAILTPPLSRDSDGDGIPDLWELRGYTQNGVFVDLPALGANPWRKDLFVWMDYMVTPGGTSLAPPQSVINNIIAVFNNAPVANPNGTTGITIHPILHNQVPYVQTLGVSSNYTQVWTDFDVLKNNSFPAAYAPAFRYMIWANTYNQGTSSGLARDIPATDFMVTLGGWGTVGGTDWQKLGTFIHELGHCLGLTHGGSDHVNYKPNYLSVMNYFFQTWGLYKNGQWGDAGYPLNFDYQRLNTPSLNKAALQEGLGLSGADDVSAYGTRYYYISGGSYYYTAVANASLGIDWNKNGVIDASPVSADINYSGSATGTLTAQNNWPNVNYSANGQIGPNAGLARSQAARLDTPQELKEELDWTTQQRLEQNREQQGQEPQQ